MIVYAGMPELGGKLTRAARDAAIPVMVSANRFRRRDRPGTWRLRTPDLDGCRVVLDSAGFVTMKLYGRYLWTPAEYARLAAIARPEWWASMDFCCEPELSADTVDRQLATTSHLLRCRVAADREEIAPPMPVLQGWEPWSYLRHAEQLDRLFRGSWPALVGVGSVCRRPLKGGTGLLAVVDRLDRELPAGVQFHLFGVKSAALSYLVTCSRVASVDSMAWDMAARRSGRGVDHRARTLLSWHRGQVEAAKGRRPFQRRLF